MQTICSFVWHRSLRQSLAVFVVALAGAPGKNTIRCMSLEDSAVVAARQAVAQVLQVNQTSAENLAGLFDQYLYLLTDDTDALLLKFAQQAEPPTVEQYEEHLSSCQTAAETIRYSPCCTYLRHANT